MAETGAWGRFVDMQMLRTIIGSTAGVILILSSVVTVSHRLLESDLTGKLNTPETKLDAVNDKGTIPSGDAETLALLTCDAIRERLTERAWLGPATKS
jgi:hypothetical protein